MTTPLVTLPPAPLRTRLAALVDPEVGGWRVDSLTHLPAVLEEVRAARAEIATLQAALRERETQIVRLETERDAAEARARLAQAAADAAKAEAAALLDRVLPPVGVVQAGPDPREDDGRRPGESQEEADRRRLMERFMTVDRLSEADAARAVAELTQAFSPGNVGFGAFGL